MISACCDISLLYQRATSFKKKCWLPRQCVPRFPLYHHCLDWFIWGWVSSPQVRNFHLHDGPQEYSNSLRVPSVVQFSAVGMAVWAFCSWIVPIATQQQCRRDRLRLWFPTRKHWGQSNCRFTMSLHSFARKCQATDPKRFSDYFDLNFDARSKRRFNLIGFELLLG